MSEQRSLGFARRGLRMAVGYLVAVAVGVALLAGSAYLPAERIDRNIGADVGTLRSEGNHHAVFWLFNTFVSDNFTDAIMLSIAWINPADTGTAVTDTFAGSYYGGVTDDPVGSLAARVAKDLPSDATYERYWQGYVPALRTALTFATYDQIRALQALLLAVFGTAVAVALWRELGWGAVAAYTLAGVVVAAPVIAVNMQFVSVFYVASTGMLAAVWLVGSRHLRGGVAARFDRTDIELFALLGALTSYVDFLTVPVVTLGMPLLTVLALEAKHAALRGAPSWHPWRRAVRASVAWGGGYALFWAAKWAINAAVLPPASVGSVGQDLSNRFGASYGVSDRIVALAKNVANLVPFSRPADHPLGVALSGELALYLALWIVGVLAVLVGGWFALRRLRGTTSLPLTQVSAILAVGALPYLWYLVVADHSSVHNFFTFRAQIVAAFAVGLFFVYSLDWSKRPTKETDRG